MEFLDKTCKIRSKTEKSEHDHQILDIQNILGVKFQLRVIILNFWTKLKEKKKEKNENYHRTSHIRIILGSKF